MAHLLPVYAGSVRKSIMWCRGRVGVLLCLLWLAGGVGKKVWAQAAPAPTPTDSLRTRLRRPALPDTARVRTCWLLARALRNEQLDSARAYAGRGVALARQVHDGPGLARGQNGLAIIEYLSGNYPAAQAAYEAALFSARRAHLNALEGNSYMGLGLVADALHNVPRAVGYFQQARVAFAKCHPPRPEDELGVLTNIGNTYLQVGQYRKAAGPLRQALALVRPTTPPAYQLNLLDLVGLLQLAQHQPDSAAATFRQELTLARAAHERRAETYALGNLASAYLARYQPAAALPYARQAVALARQTGNQSQRADFSLVLARTLHALRRPEAFDTLVRYIALHDTLQGQARSQEIVRQQTRFDVAQQQARIQVLEQQQRIDTLEAQQRQVRSRLQLGALIGSSVVLGAGLFQRYRRRQRLREAALRRQLAADLHDDVGGLLARIALQTDLLQEGLGGSAQRQTQLAEVADNSRQAVRQLNDVVWNLDAHNDSVPSLLDRLRDYAHEMLVPTGRDVRFVTEDLSGDTPDLSPAVRRQLYLVYKEALHNIVKHAPAEATVTVALYRTGRLLTLSVENTGPVEGPTSRGSGHGLRNIQVRAATLGGQATTHARPEGGFIVRVQVPV